MKRYLLLAILVASAVLSSAQQLTPEQTGGVYYAYPVTDENALPVAIPEGLEPFYISHYGRHGSRWLPDEARYVWVNEQFADDSNLTPLGRSVKRRLKKVWKNARGNAGQLTGLGARQHKGIARRMADRFPSVFAPDAQIQARSSVVPRCRASMLAFCEELKAQSKANGQFSVFKVETDSAFMPYLNYESPELKALTRQTKRQAAISPKRFISALFKDPSRIDEPLKLLSELHTIASDMQDIPLRLNLWDLFTYEEMLAVHDANNERMTICGGDTVVNHGIAARSSIALWKNIVSEADALIDNGSHGASLRFGHDTALLRLLTLLRLQLPGKGMEQIVPMAANLQIVFLHPTGNPHRTYYPADSIWVMFLLNEHPCALRLAELSSASAHDAAAVPLQYRGHPVYRWNDVKRLMDDRIHQLEHERQLYALNTMVGTAPATTRTAGLFGKGSEEHGQTLPAVLVPHGQTFWTPQTRATEKKCMAPYYYTDKQFQGIRASHWLVGGCTQDYGSFTVCAHKLQSSEASSTTTFSHADEESHPYYYKVKLPSEQLLLELTALSHAAALRVVPTDQDEQVCITLQANSDEQQATVAIDTLQRLVYLQNPVHRIYQGWGESAGFSGHLVVRYSDDLLRVSHTDSTATLVFNCRKDIPLTLFMATSFTSREGALRNLNAEVSTFSKMMQQNIARWTARLHTIDVDDPDTTLVNQFYGALYRASFLPREMSDVDGAYPKFSLTPSSRESFTADNSTNNTHLRRGARGEARYGDFSMWDTYRALHPLLCIIAPDETAQMMQSLVGMYEEGGWLPIFPCWNSYTAAMIGDHCTSVLADAWVKGIRSFDGEKAYQAMRKNALQQPATDEEYKNGMGRRALQSYIKYGYIPLEDSVKEAFHQQEQTSRTLEYAYDDFCVAQMARALGHEADYQLLMARSGNWRNVINPATGYADGRHANGQWEGNSDLIHRKPYITEGATCHYTWYVPHDIPGLIKLMGGNELFTQKLDSMFTEGRYWHGNEPCHQVPWLFTLAGHREKTSQWIRHIIDTEYNDTPGGLSGNDDAGQMSAWFIFACMGFYPVCPGTPDYVTGTPLFRRITINRPGARPYVITAEDADRLPPVINHSIFGR